MSSDDNESRKREREEKNEFSIKVNRDSDGYSDKLVNGKLVGDESNQPRVVAVPERLIAFPLTHFPFLEDYRQQGHSPTTTARREKEKKKRKHFRSTRTKKKEFSIIFRFFFVITFSPFFGESNEQQQRTRRSKTEIKLRHWLCWARCEVKEKSIIEMVRMKMFMEKLADYPCIHAQEANRASKWERASATSSLGNIFLFGWETNEFVEEDMALSGSNLDIATAACLIM